MLNEAQRRSAWGPAWLVAALAAVFALTRGFYLGDTITYAADVARYLGQAPFGAGNRLWEFGHLLWRPLGWALASLLWPVMGPAAHWSPAQVASFGLVVVSAAAGVAAVLLWRAIALDVSGSRVVAFWVALGFACANSFLTYLHSGTPYVPGLLAITLALWLLRRPRPAVWAAAALAALAALLWFPYVLAMPGLALAAVMRRDGGWNIRRAARFSMVALLCLALGFGLGAAARGIHSAAAAKAWAEDSSHGWSQSQRWLRLATGLPRAFLFLGEDGILYRRFLRQDPFAPVTPGDLVRASLWKLGVFYLFAAALVAALARDPRNRRPLLLLSAGAAPVLFFAVFLFESGSPERYLPAWPFLIVAAAVALAPGRGTRAAARLPARLVAAFIACMMAVNVYSMFRPRIDREDAAPRARLAALAAAGVRPGGVVAILSNQDAVERLCNRDLFTAICRMPVAIYDVVEPGTMQVLGWRESFAQQAVAVWQAGGDIWVSKRLRAARPRPEWSWVEGDDRRVRWQEIPAFFAPLTADGETAGEDGFVRLRRSPDNLARLGSGAARSQPQQ